MEEIDMKEEYNIKNLNPRKNPYAKKSRNLPRYFQFSLLYRFKYFEKPLINI